PARRRRAKSIRRTTRRRALASRARVPVEAREHAHHFVARELRERRTVEQRDAAAGLSAADHVRGDAALRERLAGGGGALGRERAEQRARGEGAPGIGAERAAPDAAGLEPEHALRGDAERHPGRRRE